MITAKVYMWDSLIGAVIQEDISSVPRFSYDERFLESGIEIAPLTMPLSRKIYSFPELAYKTFFGLPGALADSLPDKYGTKVFERYLTTQGRDTNSITPVERLCYMGKRGMGALEYIPEMDIGIHKKAEIDIDELVKLASDILTDRKKIHVSTMEQMMNIGTSAGGARAKAVIAWNPKTGDIRSGQVDAGNGYENWIIKFDGVKGNKDKLESDDEPQYTAIEYAYYLMAKDAGIIMTPCMLYEESGRRHFMTKRFDRNDNGEKLHMLSLEGMAHFDFNNPGENSYEQVSDIVYRLGMGAKEVEQLFRRMVFNEYAKNYDDHVKNISFLMDKNGEWSLAPAYDITYAYDKSNFWLNAHQLCIAGKRNEITDEDLLDSGIRMNLNKQKCVAILGQVRNVVADWKRYAKEVSIKKENAEAINKILNR